MQFSYFVDDQCLLDNINISIKVPHIALITGVANINLNILCGVLAGFFPIKEQLPLQQQIKSLLSLYSGRLKIHEGSIPHSTVYVGPDPEKHLLFAKVNEEMMTRLKGDIDFSAVLRVMGLDANFLQRRIASLSGGEKMKIALAITLAQDADCYVLHGVVPWLDKKGRKCLWSKLQTLRMRGARIIICDNEIEEVLPFADNFYYFDGRTLLLANAAIVQQKVNGSNYRFRQSKAAPFLSENILEFTAVSLLQHPYYSVERTTNLLDKISFTLFSSRNYLLFGSNGAGKSTIMQIIFSLIRPNSGRIKLLGRDIKNYSREQLKKNICYVSQNPAQQLIFSTLGQYRFALLDETNVLSLDLFDYYFAELPDEYPLTKLTALQYKILALLSLVTQQTKLIILDEPTWGIDHNGRACLLDLLRRLAKNLTFTLLVISHDISLAEVLDAEVLWLYNGKLMHFDDARGVEGVKTECSFCKRLIYNDIFLT